MMDEHEQPERVRDCNCDGVGLRPIIGTGRFEREHCGVVFILFFFLVNSLFFGHLSSSDRLWRRQALQRATAPP